ncbi:MAG: hypothetical protein MJ106_06530, partial [Lentisphaeria bacterium]|nr:hypothetical protein [Lentisphaeria bacterium]
MKFLQTGHTRDYPYRGKPRLENFHEKKNHIWRFLKEYIWPFKWLMLLTVFAMGLNATGSYCIAALNRIVVDDILVVVDNAGRPMTEPVVNHTAIAKDHQIIARTPPVESQGRRIARGIRLNRRPVETGKALFILAIIYSATQLFFNVLSPRAARLSVTLMTKVLGKLREDMHRKVLELSLSYQQRMSPGRLLSRIVSDTGQVRGEFAYLLGRNDEQIDASR